MSGLLHIAWLPLAEGEGGSLMTILAVVFVIISALRAIRQASRAKEEHEAGEDEAADARRAAEIRDRLRRMSEERRGGAAPTFDERPASFDRGELEVPPPVPTAPRRPPLDPFRGPLGKVLGDLERKLSEQLPPPVIRPSQPELPREEIQRRIAAAAARLERKPAREEPEVATPFPVMRQQSAMTSTAEAEAVPRRAARQRLLEDLRERDSLRRAIVLREVLGPPVGLRR